VATTVKPVTKPTKVESIPEPVTSAKPKVVKETVVTKTKITPQPVNTATSTAATVAKVTPKPTTTTTTTSTVKTTTPVANNADRKADSNTKSTTVTTTTTQSTAAKPVTSSSTTSTVANIRWQWPTKGKVIVPFSSATNGNKGIDIAGTQGQDIVAAAAGRVVYAGNALPGYGNLIIIKHNEDYLTAYAHNDRIYVQEQQDVKAGQRIAAMGRTGTSSTRLHFEIRYKAKSIDPIKYLP